MFEPLKRRWVDWRRRRIAIRRLSELDEHLLADLGTTREDIPCFVACGPCP